ncbi:transcriptional regulator [Streptomyces armeniacus]|uniref:Transcriptional regulator n=1 Tax=Streptomyces armeniacus TaxID=83291 RepID=A0A345XVI5_9ACTN|nr:transcriptional regulator [Streptomyces armeniacus]AXK35651.1 transcriptional regulator [Streptomyces armeniacus]
MEPNTLLGALLDEAGMSRLGLATRVNRAASVRGKTVRYDHSSVIRWLKGQQPRGRVPELIAETLSRRLARPLTLDDIGMGSAAPATPAVPLETFLNRATALWRGDHQQRDDLRQAPVLTGLTAVGPVWEWENPPEDTDVSRHGSVRVRTRDITALRAARSHYEQMYRKTGGVVTRSRVLLYLVSDTAPLIHGAYTDAIGRELHRATGGLVAIAGICAYDSNTQGLAQRYFHQALRLAKASGDRAFGGYVIALLVNQSLYLGEYRSAVAFAEAGLRTAGHAISPGLSCDLHAMQAKAFSRMGDRAAARRSMTLAETAAERIRPDEEPAETGYVQPGLLESNMADALMRIGDTGPAQTYAAQAVAAQTHARGRVHRLATLTDCELKAGSVDAAVNSASQMLETMAGMESCRLNDRLTKVRRSLTATNSAAAADVVEHIDGVLDLPM